MEPKPLLDENKLKKLKVQAADDLNYMSNPSAAILMGKHPFARLSIWLSLLFVILAIVWLYYAKIDKLTRGVGKVVPSLNIQYIQSFDGGIISEIFVHDGSILHKGDSLVRIDDADFKSKDSQNNADINALIAKKKRLLAESKQIPFKFKKGKNTKLNKRLRSEKKLYRAKKTTLAKEISIVKENIVQKKAELRTVRTEIHNFSKSLKLAKETLTLSRRMLKHKVLSRMQYNEKLEKVNTISGQLQSKRTYVPKIQSEIKGLRKEIKHVTLKFQRDARSELETILARLNKLNESKSIDKDKILRSVVKSPIDGIVKKMYYNTRSGVVKPGGTIAEVVPTEEHLIIDTKIQPSKIAFIYAGQSAIIRFSAYDFAMYGSLQGKVISISADTSIDEIDKQQYYTVKIKTEKNSLEKAGKKLPIKIGMVATVDIMQGKQSILDYILNPIINAKQNLLSNN